MSTTKEILLRDLQSTIEEAQDCAGFHCGNARVDRQLLAVRYFLDRAAECADDALTLYKEAIQ